MNVILNSGYVIKDVELLDKTRSPVGLLVWSTKQKMDPILTFNKLSVRASQIAGFEFNEEEQRRYSNNSGNNNAPIVRDDDMPWNNNQYKGNQY